ncbi:hypothetical protein [Vibrio sp. 99K-1]|uniref:hypothetical protein n=1 Tax=Vibrio sp. 99K-1 TaxID=2607603 RepID=UPI001493949D|nr:hypothetical protein [Vibrio sp. 99K-1]NOI88443.1 hypothetical protein [Vibrio sp. 99K-1]
MSNSPRNKQLFEKKLKFLEGIAKNSYARTTLTALGFNTSKGWLGTQTEILNQVFDPNNNQIMADADDKLAQACKRLHVCNRNITQILTADSKVMIEVRALLSRLQVPSNIYSKNFPFETIGSLTTANIPVLTYIEEQSNGWVMYFSTPKVCNVPVPVTVTHGGKKMTVMIDEDQKVHAYEVIFVPKDGDRIELRISSDTHKKQINDCLESLRDVFDNILRVNKISLASMKIVQLEKAIVSLYDQDKYGTVVDTKFISVKNRTVMPRTTKRSTDNCLRDQQYHKAGEKVEQVKCIGVKIQFKKRTTKKNLLVTTKLHLECDPVSDYKTCNYLILDNPIGNTKVIETLDHILKSNK